jgi:hypothetical protein
VFRGTYRQSSLFRGVYVQIQIQIVKKQLSDLIFFEKWKELLMCNDIEIPVTDNFWAMCR